jgi:hypothetical protein
MTAPLLTTSTLYASVVLHAYRAQCAAYHHLFLLVLSTSLMLYSGGLGNNNNNQWLARIDRAAAHAGFLYVVCVDVPRAPWPLALFPAAVAGLWLSEGVWPQHAQSLHALLHVTSVVGLHCFLRTLYDDGDGGRELI